jgi:hypothetical protein
MTYRLHQSDPISAAHWRIVARVRDDANFLRNAFRFGLGSRAEHEHVLEHWLSPVIRERFARAAAYFVGRTDWLSGQRARQACEVQATIDELPNLIH